LLVTTRRSKRQTMDDESFAVCLQRASYHPHSAVCAGANI
jgi:hypothetical protein